jgi:hypothetical protein
LTFSAPVEIYVLLVNCVILDGKEEKSSNFKKATIYEKGGDFMANAEKHLICGIHITDRVVHAQQVQQVLTEYGTYIKTRMGLHEVSAGFSSPNGLILLEFVQNEAKFKELTKKLGAITGVEVQQMIFDHP